VTVPLDIAGSALVLGSLAEAEPILITRAREYGTSKTTTQVRDSGIPDGVGPCQEVGEVFSLRN